MEQYKTSFDTYMGVKSEPNDHEKQLLQRADHFIQKISDTAGVEMIAVVNSLSMYATHADSDIDLFIVTRPGMLWYVRFFVTLKLWRYGVWRHGADIAGNFCLSFFVTSDAMDLSKVRVENDIYLYYWIYYLKPIFVKDTAYEDFLRANSWVHVDEKQKRENERYRIDSFTKAGVSVTAKNHSDSVNDDVAIQFSKTPGSLRSSRGRSHKKGHCMFSIFLNNCIRLFLLPKTLRNYRKLGKPEGVIISDAMLKFHDQDQRKAIRDAIVEKNFDK